MFKPLHSILTLAMTVCALLTTFMAKGEIQTTSVFTINEGGSKYYRIPALCNTANGNLIAIADERGAYVDDLTPNEGTVKLVAKISHDNGKTWGEKFDLFPGWKDEKGNLITHGDAAVALYPRTGDLICVFAAKQSYHTSDLDNPGEIYMSTSKDNGETWSTPARIDHQLATQINEHNASQGSSRRFFTGFAASGNMLVTPYGVAFVMNARHADERTNTAKGYEYVCALYDDDYANNNWRVLNPGAPVCSDGSGNESKMAELSGDKIIMSIRTNGQHRFAYSDDRGKTWTDPSAASTDGDGYSPVNEPGCNGGFVRQNVGSGDRLFLSLPASSVSSARHDVTIYYSDDNGTHWKQGKQLINGASGYSALRVLANGNIGALVERGNDTDGYDIQFFNIPMGDLITQELHENFTGTLACNGQGYLEIPNDYASNPESSPFSVTDFEKGFTFTTRVFLTQYGAARGIVASRWHNTNSSNNKFYKTSGFAIYGGWQADNCLGANVTMNNTTSRYVSANPPVLDHKPIQNVLDVGQSSHIALTMKADDNGDILSQVYVDGILVDEGRVKSTDATKYDSPYKMYSMANLLLGCRYKLDGTNCSPRTDDIWLGDIDDVRFYDRSMTAEEVCRDMDSGFPILTKGDGLIAAYDFSAEDENGNYLDISGNGLNAIKKTIDGYTFPTLDHEAVTVTPVSNEEEGMFHIKEFVNGEERDLYNNETSLSQPFKTSLNKDLYACAVAHDGYELVGIYVNGFPLTLQTSPDGGLGAYFKANSEEGVTVWAKFREIDKPMNFYLSGDFNGNTPEAKDKFEHIGDDTYLLKFSGILQGVYHIVELPDVSHSPDGKAAEDTDNNASGTIQLYSSVEHRVNGGDTSVAMKPSVLYNVQNPRWSDILLDFNLDPANELLKYNPVFTLVYKPIEGIRKFSVDQGTISGIEGVTDDIPEVTDYPGEYFNLQGKRLADKPTAPGIYILRQGASSTKEIIR